MTIEADLRKIISSDPQLLIIERACLSCKNPVPFLISWDRALSGHSYYCYDRIFKIISSFWGMAASKPVSQVRLVPWISGRVSELIEFTHGAAGVYNYRNVSRSIIAIELPLVLGSVATYYDNLSSAEASFYIPNSHRTP